LSPVCGIEATDTTGWREFISRHGRFTIHLPANASERLVSCVDSECGTIHVGDWSISYDSGPFIGSGDHVKSDTGEVSVQSCNLRIAGRTVSVAVGRYSIDPRLARSAKITDSSWVDDLFAQAAMPMSNERGGLYLSMHTKRQHDRAIFLTAMQTIRMVKGRP